MTYDSSIKSRYVKWKDSRVTQGDILEALTFSIGSAGEDSKLSGQYYSFKYAVVMSQDCDLQWHHEALTEGNSKSRALLNTILICPAYPIEEFRAGTHVDSVEIEALTISKKEITPNNKQKRYHYLEFDESAGVNELIIDFKEFYTVPYNVVEIARKERYVATINELFRENLSQRFSSYLSRIGLPELGSNE